MNTTAPSKKIVGQTYPSEILRDPKTGKPIMIKENENSEEIRQSAAVSARNLISALENVDGASII